MANSEMRLVDANALMDSFRSHMVERYDRNKCTLEENCKTCQPGCLWRKKVMAAPTVDAVPVVRCKDCKYYREGEIFKDIKFCFRLRGNKGKPVGYNFSEDDFCSRGERRDGE